MLNPDSATAAERVRQFGLKAREESAEFRAVIEAIQRGDVEPAVLNEMGLKAGLTSGEVSDFRSRIARARRESPLAEAWPKINARWEKLQKTIADLQAKIELAPNAATANDLSLRLSELHARRTRELAEWTQAKLASQFVAGMEKAGLFVPAAQPAVAE